MPTEGPARPIRGPPPLNRPLIPSFLQQVSVLKCYLHLIVKKSCTRLEIYSDNNDKGFRHIQLCTIINNTEAITVASCVPQLGLSNVI